MTSQVIAGPASPGHDRPDLIVQWCHSRAILLFFVRFPREEVTFPTMRRAIIMGSAFDQAKGRIKQAVGDLTGNKKLRAEGKSDEAAGKAKRVVADTKRKTDAVVNQAKDNLDGLVDKARNKRTKD